jgi:hypothetical protein
MYIELWNRNHEIDGLDKLLEFQYKGILSNYPDVKFFYDWLDSGPYGSQRKLIRRVEIIQYPSAEISGFNEFDHFIFFTVLFSPFSCERRNIRKLEHLLDRVLPLSVKQV